MRKIFLLMIFLSLLGRSLPAQSDSLLNGFKTAFKGALRPGFSEEDLNSLMQSYDSLLDPFQHRIDAQGRSISEVHFSLERFTQDPDYQTGLAQLIASENVFQRLLAYSVIVAAGDRTREALLVERLTKDPDPRARSSIFFGLIFLGSSRTTPIFDYLVENEDLGDAHLFPFFIAMNKDSLEQTAYNRINSENEKAKIFAAQIFTVTESNSKTEQLLRHAVKTWNINIKGYAIFPMKKFRYGNLAPLLEPLLDSSATRAISLEALANSPSPEDSALLIKELNKSDTVSREILNAFYNSDNPERVKYWTELLYTRKIPPDYVFFVIGHPLINSDQLLNDLHTALLKVKLTRIRGELIRALGGRDDNKSVEIIQMYLKDKSPSVRFWTARTVADSASAKFRTPEMKALIASGLKDGNTADE